MIVGSMSIYALKRFKSQFGCACWQVYGVWIYHIQIVSHNPALVLLLHWKVPKSSRKLHEDNDYALYNVTLFRNVTEIFKAAAHNEGFQVCPFPCTLPLPNICWKICDLGGWQRALCLSPVVPLRWISSMYWWNLLCILLCWWYVLCILLLCCCIETCA
jgi:hypothetical protein